MSFWVLAVLALLIYRQLAARPVNASALRLIAILAVIGLIQTYQFLSKGHNYLVNLRRAGQPGACGDLRRAAG